MPINLHVRFHLNAIISYTGYKAGNSGNVGKNLKNYIRCTFGNFFIL